MPLHIVKLCVGVASIEELATWQKDHLRAQKAAGETPRIFHATLQTPKRDAEVLDGGSLYWVIKGLIQVRQRITRFEDGARDDGSPCCHIVLDPKLVSVRFMPRRAFQGWRYLTDEDAPEDLDRPARSKGTLSPEMRRALIDLGLL
jgi:hypothetical protein